MPSPASSSTSVKSACGSTTTPLPMTQVTPGCRMPDGIRCSTNFWPPHVDGVPGVVAALVAGDDREVRREQVDDLALALVAPLRAEHCDVHDSRPWYYGYSHVRHADAAMRQFGPTRAGTPTAQVPDRLAAMMSLDGDSLTLDASSRPSPTATTPVALAARGARPRRSRRAPSSTAKAAGDDAGLRHQHRLRLVRRSRASRTTTLGALQLNLLRSHAAGVGEPLPDARGARDDGAARQRAGAAGYSGIRVEHARRAARAAQRAGAPGRARRAARSAPAAISRPLAHLALVLIGEGEATVGGDAACAGARGARARPASRRSTLQPKEGLALINGTQPSAAVLALALRRRRAAGPRGRHRRGALDRRAARLDPSRSRRASTTRGRSPASATSAANIARAAGGQRHQRVARELRPRAGRVLAALRGAGARRGARRARLRARTRRRSRRTPRPTTRWSSPTRATSSRAATSTARRSRVAADLLAIAVAQLATISERRTDRLVNPALSGLPAVPHARRRPAVGAHDGAGHRGGAHLRDQDARAPGVGRHDPDLRQQGGPRQHEHGGRAQGRARAVVLARHVLAIELLCAAQAIDLLAPLTTSRAARARARHAFARACRRSTTIVRRRPTSRRSTR